MSALQNILLGKLKNENASCRVVYSIYVNKYMCAYVYMHTQTPICKNMEV